MRYLLLFIGCFYALQMPNVVGQTMEQQRLADRLESLERSLSILEKEFYRNEKPKKPLSFFDSDDDNEDSTDETATGNVEIRLSDLERKIRELTGQLEETSYQQRQLILSLEKQMSATEWRLTQIEKASGIDASNFTPAPDTELNDNDTSEEEKRGDGTRILGTIPEEQTRPLGEAPQNARKLYDDAFALLRQTKYEEATAAFQNFINDFPRHELISNAYYWLGESHYVQKRYEEASVAFLNGYQEAPKGNKAADNLLKLAMSLSSLNKGGEACTTFDKLLNELPNSSATIRRRAEKERNRIGCRQ